VGTFRAAGERIDHPAFHHPQLARHWRRRHPPAPPLVSSRSLGRAGVESVRADLPRRLKIIGGLLVVVRLIQFSSGLARRKLPACCCDLYQVHKSLNYRLTGFEYRGLWLFAREQRSGTVRLSKARGTLSPRRSRDGDVPRAKQTPPSLSLKLSIKTIWPESV
jgi:hypothetical protein